MRLASARPATMKRIFECETELGPCDADRVNGHFGDDPSGWTALAYTMATATGGRASMLRIEQRCYLRSTDRPEDVRPQSWVRPEMTLEPLLGSKHETTEMVQELHDQFVQKAKEEFLQQSILMPALGVCPV